MKRPRVAPEWSGDVDEGAAAAPPLAVGQAAGVAGAGVPHPERGGGSTVRVLICDDALFARTVLAEAIRGAGYEVVGYAGDGTEAVAQYAKLMPDLVTLNLVMPGIGGLEALRRILEVDPEARVVVCSAVHQELLTDAAFARGARAFVVKPYAPSRLLAALNTALTGCGSMAGSCRAADS